MRVPRQTVGEVTTQRGDVEARVRDDGGHSGAAVRPGDGHPVDHRVEHARTRAEDLGDLGGGDVLALPAEGVAEAVDEVEVALVVASHEVARAKPGVIRLEYVSENLPLGGIGAGVAFEPRTDVHRIRGDLP